MALTDRDHEGWLATETGNSCSISRWLKGGNNLLGKVVIGSEERALKVYRSEPSDQRDRSGTEYKALKFLERNGCRNTPKAFVYSNKPPRLLMDWLDGEPALNNISDSDLIFSAEFLAYVAKTSCSACDNEFAMASESCLSDKDILSQIESRYLKLIKLVELDEFFARFNNLLKAEIDKVAKHPWFNEPLPKTNQRLIPADYSLHNVIRQKDGVLKVFDFEYFGWDDPVKGVADFLLHPAMNLSDTHKRLFLNKSIALFETFDEGFTARLKARYNLFALRWALIVLRPYLESNVSREVKRQRLDKAVSFLDRVELGFNF